MIRTLANQDISSVTPTFETTTDTSYTVTLSSSDLNQNLYYYVSVAAVNNCNVQTPYSSPLGLTFCAPPVTPVVDASKMSSPDFNITWSSAADLTFIRNWNLYIQPTSVSPNLSKATATKIPITIGDYGTYSLTQNALNKFSNTAQSFVFAMTCVNVCGEESAFSNITTFCPSNATVNAPTGYLSVVWDNPSHLDVPQLGTVTVSWLPVPGATGYNVYCNLVPSEGSSRYISLSQTSNKVASITDGSVGTASFRLTKPYTPNEYTFWWTVTSISGCGSESPFPTNSKDYSSTNCETVPQWTSDKFNVQVINGPSGKTYLNVSWAPVQNASTYKVYMSPGSVRPSVKGAPLLTTSIPNVNIPVQWSGPSYYTFAIWPANVCGVATKAPQYINRYVIASSSTSS